MHTGKRGIRALGIAESFRGRSRSVLAGVVMRRDLLIDGVAFGEVTVGGTDATRGVIELYRKLRRCDINFLMLGGCVIAWYNIIDPAELFNACGVPVIVVTYEDSEGLEDDIRRHFPGDTERLSAYRRLGQRRGVKLHTGYEIYIRSWGLDGRTDEILCQQFTHVGKVPEPIRVARLAARAMLNHYKVPTEEHMVNRPISSDEGEDTPRDERDRDGGEEHPEHPCEDTDHDIPDHAEDQRG